MRNEFWPLRYSDSFGDDSDFMAGLEVAVEREVHKGIADAVTGKNGEGIMGAEWFVTSRSEPQRLVLHWHLRGNDELPDIEHDFDLSGEIGDSLDRDLAEIARLGPGVLGEEHVAQLVRTEAELRRLADRIAAVLAAEKAVAPAAP
jgi:hypothetical protein